MKNISSTFLLLVGVIFTLPGFSQTYIQVTVNQPPPLIISDLVYHDIIEGNTVTLGGDDIVTGGYGGYVYEWTPSELLDFDTILKPVASPATTTSFTLTVTDRQGCKQSAMQTVTVAPSGINDLPQDYSINVFPNPTTGELNIRIKFPGQIDKITYSVYNSLGSLMHTLESHAATETLDLKDLGPGSYTLIITSQDFTYRKHIILHQ